MDVFIIKNTENNTIHTIQESDVLLLLLDEIISKVLLQSILFSSIFSIHSSSNLSIILFLQLQFYNLNTLQYRMIYHIYTHNY